MPTFDLIRDLPLVVDDYSLSGLSVEVRPEFTRHCTVVRLDGGGLTGVGEDVVYDPEDHFAFQEAGPVHSLDGQWTLGEFCAAVGELDLFPRAPAREESRLYRLWAFHSAALDLALRQAELTLHAALGRAPQPMTYVASTRLGEPPTLDPVRRRLDLDPTLRFKLDATSSWTPELIAGLVQTGAVDSVDFKGLYRGTGVDQPGDPVLYQRVVDAFPEAWLEDPDLTPETTPILLEATDRITWDFPIHTITDIENLPFAPRMVNIKPSRVGSLESLFAMYDYCDANGIGAYGGGQTEIGPGRGQAQYLAALFHPDTPNDLAPAAYNQMDPPSGLPSSPLAADLSSPGFRWPGD